MMIEIIAGANGWIVKPSWQQHEGMPINQSETFVFNNAEDLGKHVAEWGKKQLEPRKVVVRPTANG